MSNADTVVLSRKDYEALLAALEDAEDRATFAAAREREATLGKAAARDHHLPVELVERLLAGDSPVRVWREHRGLSRHALAAEAALALGYLAAIETGRRRGGIATLRRLARALRVPLDELVA
mgnify:CR=1 FL=1